MSSIFQYWTGTGVVGIIVAIAMLDTAESRLQKRLAFIVFFACGPIAWALAAAYGLIRLWVRFGKGTP